MSGGCAYRVLNVTLPINYSNVRWVQSYTVLNVTLPINYSNVRWVRVQGA